MEGVANIPRADFVLHSEGGWTKRIGNVDASGVAVDISARTYKLRTESGLDIAFVADPDNPMGQMIALTEAQVAEIRDLADRSTKFAIVDTTDDPDEVQCFGRLIVEGW